MGSATQWIFAKLLDALRPVEGGSATGGASDTDPLRANFHRAVATSPPGAPHQARRVRATAEAAPGAGDAPGAPPADDFGGAYQPAAKAQSDDRTQVDGGAGCVTCQPQRITKCRSQLWQ